MWSVAVVEVVVVVGVVDSWWERFINGTELIIVEAVM